MTPDPAARFEDKFVLLIPTLDTDELKKRLTNYREECESPFVLPIQREIAWTGIRLISAELATREQALDRAA